MFWKRKSSAPRDFKPPTSFDKKMGFEKWLAKAYEVFKWMLACLWCMYAYCCSNYLFCLIIEYACVLNEGRWAKLGRRVRAFVFPHGKIKLKQHAMEANKSSIICFPVHACSVCVCVCMMVLLFVLLHCSIYIIFLLLRSVWLYNFSIITSFTLSIITRFHGIAFRQIFCSLLLHLFLLLLL